MHPERDNLSSNMRGMIERRAVRCAACGFWDKDAMVSPSFTSISEIEIGMFRHEIFSPSRGVVVFRGVDLDGASGWVDNLYHLGGENVILLSRRFNVNTNSPGLYM
jgi:hypothetical protein